MATLAACGGSNSDDKNGSQLSDVQYSLNGPTAEASASFETPFVAEGTSTHVIDEGDGEELKDGDVVVLNATSFNGQDGSKLGSTFTSQPIMVPVNDSLKEQVPELYDVLSQGKVGMSFSYTSNMVQAADETGNASPSPLPSGSATNVEIYSVASKVLNTAEGTEVTEGLHESFVEFKLDDNAQFGAVIDLKDDRGDAPAELVSQDLIEGNGQVVGETDTVYAKYFGLRWEDGHEFDGNYNAELPAQFSLTSVIPGWTEGLAGHKVGSRVLLIIPSEKAYGDEDETGSGRPTGPLVFVVDILGASAGPEVESEEAEPTATAEETE